MKTRSKVNGKAYTDAVQDSFGQTTYGMAPYSGTNDTGTRGAEVYSVAFYPASETYGGNTAFCFATSGTCHNLTGSKWYGGEALETVGPQRSGAIPTTTG